MKTSSPIENVGDCKEEVSELRKEGAVSPILFPCEDNETEEANMDNRYIKKAVNIHSFGNSIFFLIGDESFLCDSFFPLNVMHQI